MNCVRDTCVIEPTLLSLKKESVQSLQNYCRKFRINAFTDVDSSMCQHLINTDCFKLLKGNILVYLPNYISLGNFTLVESIINNGNIIAVGNRYYIIDNGLLKEISVSSIKGVIPYIESFLGFTNSGMVINTCYIKILTTQDAYYHIVFDGNSTIQIAPELPYRYPLDFYIQTIESISRIIKPPALTKVVQLSADVSKEVIC